MHDYHGDLMAAIPAMPNAEDCNCFAVRAAARHVTQFYDQCLASTGLRTSQFSILAKLKRKGTSTINALADEMVMDRTTLSRNIMPLEREGLIVVEPTGSDRRSKELRLSKAGERRLRDAQKAWSEAQIRFESGFGTGRSSQLRRLLRSVVSAPLVSEA
jgi:DNA-binding MarR family transcriptional regulator